MKTEQEQIEQIEKVLKYSVADYKHLKKKGVCYCYAETLIDHGYGDISEYKAEIERLKSEIIKQDQVIIERNFELVELEDKVKQAQIDVLNKVKDLMDKYYVFEGVCGYFIDDFKELIKEIEEQ